ncbi:hypothetical protein KFU94_20975 [Chloroflexi bacterium TSY]|nr:hypothetical protein [Chloroflexi bacterium TSY]
MLPTPRLEMRGALIDGLIYIPGGWGGESTFEVYNPAVNEWRTLTDLPQGRHHFMTTAHDGQPHLFGALWLIGGSDRAGAEDNQGRVLRFIQTDIQR